MEEVLDLGFGRCKLQVQVPEKGDVTSASELVGRNVVTSFTGLSEAFFARMEGSADGRPQKTKVKYVGGSVEAACALGVADGIVDLVESGETMKAAGLKAVDTVVESTAVLVKSKNTRNELVDLIASRIRGVISACPVCFAICLADNVQLPKSSSSVSTTSPGPNSVPPVGSLPASARRLLLRSKRTAGWQSVRWWRRRRLPMSWTS